VFCQPVQADWVLINGQQTVRNGLPVLVDYARLCGNHNQLARQLAS
jgi:hypothetical protein